MRVLQVTFQNPVGTHVFLRSYNLLTPRFVFDLAKLGLVLAYLGSIGLARVTRGPSVPACRSETERFLP